MKYSQFLEQKRLVVNPVGLNIQDGQLNDLMFDWQKAITKWALFRGRAALFLDTGLGKSFIQLEWAKHIYDYTGQNILILAPLAVSKQTKREAEKFAIGTNVTVCKTGDDVQPGINITNYERLHHFEDCKFGGIVLDESGILKSFGGKIRKQITDFSKSIKFRLACTATPAPNDLIELSNHAEYLDIMTGKEIIALFFKTDGNTTHSWRLKGHAKEAFWTWMAEWAIAIRKPSDIGYEDNGFILPPLNRHDIVIPGIASEGELFPTEAKTLLDRRQARRDSMEKRVKICADMVNQSDDCWLVWCDLNAESEMLKKQINECVEVQGKHSPEYKEQSMMDFTDGKTKVLVSKPTICGFGMNWQHCNKMAFVGLSDSFEQMYQATRRCWRFGQKNPVDVYVITSENEGAVVANIERKEKQAALMFDEIVKHMDIHTLSKKAKKKETKYNPTIKMELPTWI